MWKLTLGYAIISKWICAIWVDSSTFTCTLLLQGVGMASASLCTRYSPHSKRKTTASLHNGPVFHHHTQLQCNLSMFCKGKSTEVSSVT